MKTYKVTSPLMRGDEVRRIQRRLAGANVFRENFKPGKIDGRFGEDCAAACYRAKYWLGYPTKEITRFYGPRVEAFLAGKQDLPPAFKNRRRARKKATTLVPRRVRALREAAKQIGKKESPPGSNKVLFSTWYGVTGPWCAMFVTHCYVKVGSRTFIRGSRYAYVPYIVADARRGGRGLAITRDPQPGDLCCFDWDRNGVFDHVGLYEKKLPGARFQTVEGNTAVGNDSNGGQVMRRQRHRDGTVVFVRVTK